MLEGCESESTIQFSGTSWRTMKAAGWSVGRIFDDVFLLSNPDKEAGALTLRELLFDMVGREHLLKVTNGVIAEGVNVVAENQGVRLGLDQAGFVDDDRQADHLVLGLSYRGGEQHGGQAKHHR